MNTRVSRILSTAAALVAVSGTLLVSARPARADLLNLSLFIDVRPNLKVVSWLSKPIYNPGTGAYTRYLAFTIQNTGLTTAPASTAWVQLEAGDPFSPISTAIAISPYATPSLAAGASTPVTLIPIGDAVYIKADIWADKFDVVNERTNADNHRVHTVGYTP